MGLQESNKNLLIVVYLYPKSYWF